MISVLVNGIKLIADMYTQVGKSDYAFWWIFAHPLALKAMDDGGPKNNSCHFP